MSAARGTPEHRWRQDVPRSLAVLVGCVLLGAPAGLLWSWVAPRLTVTFGPDGPGAADLESTKAFIGADASFVLVGLAFGAGCGALAWFFARRSGPWTVVALTVGGLLAATVAARVGVIPGSQEVIEALRQGGQGRRALDLYLGGPFPDQLKDGALPHLRATWAVLAWPVGALLAFLVGALKRPEELD